MGLQLDVPPDDVQNMLCRRASVLVGGVIINEQAYTPDYHAESDTFDKVNQTELKNNAVIAAAVVWGFAEMPDWPLKRQSRTEVEELLKRTRIEEQMKLFGQWKAWESGQRP